jgi:hypothetical protein
MKLAKEHLLGIISKTISEALLQYGKDSKTNNELNNNITVEMWDFVIDFFQSESITSIFGNYRFHTDNVSEKDNRFQFSYGFDFGN